VGGGGGSPKGGGVSFKLCTRGKKMGTYHGHARSVEKEHEKKKGTSTQPRRAMRKKEERHFWMGGGRGMEKGEGNLFLNLTQKEWKDKKKGCWLGRKKSHPKKGGGTILRGKGINIRMGRGTDGWKKSTS